MPLSTAQKLQSLGVSGRLGVEIQRQITANAGNANRLIELGMAPPALAKLIAAAITADTLSQANKAKAVEHGMPPRVVNMLATVIAGD